ncbi:MAG TPA: hypothetical protein VIM87_26735 [Chitinophaga sp.]|uniref:hypothetical protein n=1 Tax=Chitinophaga sp. TaxID=1869181 RepID=UPI002F950BA9
MLFRNLLQLPEILLFLPLPFMLYYGNAAIDIHMHDTYFVIGQAGYAALLLAFPQLFTSWIIHVLLRRKALLSAKWRWAQVAITLLCPLVVGIFANTLLEYGMPGMAGMPRRYYDYGAFSNIQTRYMLLFIFALVFILSQLVFWIAGAVLLIRRPSR